MALTTAGSLLSSLCGCDGACTQRSWFTKLEAVSVAVHNKGGKFFHPIGNVREVATIGLSPLSTGKMRPKFGVSARQRLIWKKPLDT